MYNPFGHNKDLTIITSIYIHLLGLDSGDKHFNRWRCREVRVKCLERLENQNVRFIKHSKFLFMYWVKQSVYWTSFLLFSDWRLPHKLSMNVYIFWNIPPLQFCQVWIEIKVHQEFSYCQQWAVAVACPLLLAGQCT